MKTSLHSAEQAHSNKDSELETLRARLSKLQEQTDNLKIDLAARDTEAESLKFRTNAMREERDRMRQDFTILQKRAKEAEQKLSQQQHMVIRLEDKAAREAASAADKEALLGRRQQEITKLKEQLKAANAEIRKAAKILRDAGLSKAVADLPAEVADGEPEPSALDVAAVTAQMGDNVRRRSAALAEHLQKARNNTGRDSALREEITSIAASVVALTALKEGPSSPILSLMPDKPKTGSNDRVNLADRAAAIIADPQR